MAFFSLDDIRALRRKGRSFTFMGNEQVVRGVSDEVHRVLTQASNPYIIDCKVGVIRERLMEVREAIVRDSCLAPLEKLYILHMYIKNHLPDQVESYKNFLMRMLPLLEEQCLIKYVEWLLSDPCKSVAISVYIKSSLFKKYVCKAYVSISTEEGDIVANGMTGPDGVFRMTLLPIASYWVSVEYGDYYGVANIPKSLPDNISVCLRRRT